jgi:hypothetical protein
MSVSANSPADVGAMASIECQCETVAIIPAPTIGPPRQIVANTADARPLKAGGD